MTTYAYDALTADGRIIRLRPSTPQDASALLDLYHGASDQSRHRRFLSLGTRPVEADVRRLTRPEAPDHAVCVASHGDQIVGVASYERMPGTDLGDFALLVADEWHGNGVGTLLLEQLAAQGRREGVRRLVGEILRENIPMVQVVRGMSPDAQLRAEVDLTFFSIDTEPGTAGVEAQELRERTAESHSLRPLLAPAVVAVVCAGRQPGGTGHEVLAGITARGFTGRVYAVNPHATIVAGQPCHPTVAAVPERVDLVVIAVPADQVEGALADAGAAGARAAVVLSAGFSEAGAAGRVRQARLVRTARAHGIRLVGPNCLGVLNTDPEIRLSAMFGGGAEVTAGGLAIASQSGAVGTAMLDHAARTGAGISTFVSLGNKADVSGNDLLSYWFDDPATQAVALYLESFGNPRKFARIARAIARRKPVLAVKSGRSQGGVRAGASHTAAPAASDVAVDSLFAQAGVVRTDTLGELLDAARVLTGQPLPAGRRVGIVGNAGGMNVLAADAAEAAGLVLPDLAAGGGNPVDLGADTTPDMLVAAVRRMAASGEVDALFVIFAATPGNRPAETVTALSDALDIAATLPVAVVLVGVQDPPTVLGERRVPVFDLPEPGVRALGRAAAYAEWRRTPLGTRPVLSGVDPARARRIVDDAVAAGPGWQSFPVVSDLLTCYGIPVIDGRVVRTPPEAVEAADAIGYPVVLKATDPGIGDKSDRGLVRLDLTDAAAVADAYRSITAELGSEAAMLVRPMRTGGVELVAGVVHDSLFGSLVMAGLGGVHTELLADRVSRLLPVTDADAAAMWRGLRGAPLLTGYRGSAPTDTVALEDLLCRLGRLAEDLPEVAELDLDPVLAFPEGVLAVDAKVSLRPVGTEPDPAVRMLRPA